MLDTYDSLLIHFVTAFIRLGRNQARMIWLCMAALVAPPVMASEQCIDLGIKTVNWKAPDNTQTGVMVLQAVPDCVAAKLGVWAGEIITGFNGQPVGNQYDLEKLAGTYAADQAFSLTLKDGAGREKMLLRDAVSIRPASEIPHDTTKGISSDWLPWLGWAGLFLVLTLTLSPIMWWILKNHAPMIMLGGAAGSMYDEFKGGGRKYVEAGVQGALISFFGVLAIILIGPVGFLYNLYQPLTATLSNADQRVCCVEDKDYYALSPDGRWLAMVKPTPNRYFGLGDKIVRMPYVAALADLKSGQFIAWRNAVDHHWIGVEPSANSSLDKVYFDEADGRPYIKWSNSFSTILEPADQPALTWKNVPALTVRFKITSDTGNAFTFSDAASGKSFVLNPGQTYDKWWLSADGSVLALATRPRQPDAEYDGWFTRIGYTLRDFLLGDWRVTFYDVAGQRKLATYKGYGYDEKCWENGLFLEASQDGRHWVMVRENGFALSFNLTGKMKPDHAARIAPIYRPQTDLNEIKFYRDTDTANPENLEKLAALVNRHPFEFMETDPQLAKALKAALGQAHGPLMEMLTLATPASATPNGGLTYSLCKAHACPDGSLVVYISPSLDISAVLFHDDGEIDLPETPHRGEIDPDNWSRLVLYERSAYPQKMSWYLYQAALAEPRGMKASSIDDRRDYVSHRFWIVGKLPE